MNNDIKNKKNLIKNTEKKTTHDSVRKNNVSINESVSPDLFQYARKPNKPNTTVEFPDYDGKKTIVLTTKKGNKK
ncbi:MAG: hypothetical protein IJ398_06025 [Clostridia bacterium]|nr:hypothetical protein [Clostridia bacterium]